ncbi:MAG: hypothetical protein EON95_08275 [Caulobacteraceae bacterium]|nr:hypothetical protein [Caulobacter sp.]RYF93624.1 MAG: hypothetical protein EON95_08275 [Caulobacteraceae bacterium]
MTDNTQPGGKHHGFPWRATGWSGLALLLSLPLILHFPWTASDFVLAGVVLGGAGLIVELIVWASSSLTYRIGGLIALLASVGLLWVNGAVGFLGDEHNPANLLFLGVIAIAVAGAVVVRFKAAGLSRVLAATALAQLLVGVVGYAAGWASPGVAGLTEVALGTALFGALWLSSAGLFHWAARTGG